MIFCSSYFWLNAQTAVYKSVQLNTILTNYSITATNDTTFNSEVEIIMNDTIGFQNMTAVLNIQTETGWLTVASNTVSKPIGIVTCSIPLCFYRRNATTWVLYLGAYSLLTRHKIELHFNSFYSNVINTDWNDEF